MRSTTPVATGHPLDANTILLARLDEAAAASNAVDSTGTYTLVHANSPGVGSGQIGGYRSFDGVNQRFEGTGNAAAIACFTGDHTVAFWIRATSIPATGTQLISYGGPTVGSETEAQNYLMDLYLMADGRMLLQREHDAGVTEQADCTTGTAIVTGTFYHFAMVSDGTTIKFYVNGILQQTVTGVPLSGGGSSAKWFIGATDEGGDKFVGRLDDIGISNVARDDEFIRSLYLSGIAVSNTADTNRSRSEHLKVEIKDAGGTFRDMSTYPGFDALTSASWSETIDDPGANAEVVLKREVELLSLSPFMETSPVNKAFNVNTAFAAVVDVGREIKISVAVIPSDSLPIFSDWLLVFHGFINSVDPSSEDMMVLGCRDKSSVLADAQIEVEHVHAFASVASLPVALRVWSPSTAWTLNEYGIPTEARRDVNGSKRFYKVTTAGTGGATEPVWPNSGTVADGSAVWTFQATTSKDVGFPVEDVIQTILTANGTGVTLHTPTPTGLSITQYLQDRTSVLEAIRNLVLQFGLDIRYKWRTSTSQFELTLYTPERTSPSSVRTFTKSEYAQLSGLVLDLSGIRNAIRVNYPDLSDKRPSGEPKRKTVIVTNSASITRYGRRFMEITEDDSSLIDSSTEATTMATACLNDLKDPKIDQQLELVHGFPFAEINDYYTFTANGRHYSTNQSLALFSVQHEASEGKMKTTLSCRGTPSGGYLAWHDKDIRNFPLKRHGMVLFEASNGVTLTASAAPGGTKIKVSGDSERIAHGQDFEYHISASSGFTPSSSTLVTLSRDREILIGDLKGGKTYYCKVSPRSRNGSMVVAGEPSNELSFVAGKVRPHHLDTELGLGFTPPNGGFEGRFDGDSFEPDNWTMVTGTFNTDASTNTADSQDGAVAIRLDNTTVAAKMRSDFFLADASIEYVLEGWVKKVATPDDSVQIAVEWYDITKTIISTTTISQALNGIGTGWTRLFTTVTSPSTAKFAKVFIAKAVATAFACNFDAIRIYQTAQATIAPTLLNSWVNFGSGHQNAGYYKDPHGRVFLQGLVKDGVATTIFTLPVGYRPGATEYFSTVTSADAMAVGYVDSSGNVVRQSGNSTYFSLSGVNFRAV